MAAPNNNNNNQAAAAPPMVEGYESDPDQVVPVILDVRFPPEFDAPVAWHRWREDMPPERPDWLPNDWGMEPARSSSRSRYYYIAPSGKLLRSKNEVLRFLEHAAAQPQEPEAPPVAGRGRRARRRRRG